MLEKGIDTIVLGCTHYPFVIPLIQEIVGEKVRVIDPAPAVARQARRLLEASGLKRPDGPRGQISFYTTGEADAMQTLLPLLLGETGKVGSIQWKNDHQLETPEKVSPRA